MGGMGRRWEGEGDYGKSEAGSGRVRTRVDENKDKIRN